MVRGLLHGDADTAHDPAEIVALRLRRYFRFILSASAKKAQRGQAAATGAQRRGQPPTGRCPDGVKLDALLFILGRNLCKLLGCVRRLPHKGSLQSAVLFSRCIELGFYT
jgi:hypothetical protein